MPAGAGIGGSSVSCVSAVSRAEPGKGSGFSLLLNGGDFGVAAKIIRKVCHCRCVKGLIPHVAQQQSSPHASQQASGLKFEELDSYLYLQLQRAFLQKAKFST